MQGRKLSLNDEEKSRQRITKHLCEVFGLEVTKTLLLPDSAPSCSPGEQRIQLQGVNEPMIRMTCPQVKEIDWGSQSEYILDDQLYNFLTKTMLVGSNERGPWIVGTVDALTALRFEKMSLLPENAPTHIKITLEISNPVQWTPRYSAHEYFLLYREELEEAHNLLLSCGRLKAITFTHREMHDVIGEIIHKERK